MRIVKCDYCGAEITEKHHDIEKCYNPSDKGWVTIQGRRLCIRWERDCCPNCLKKLDNGHGNLKK